MPFVVVARDHVSLAWQETPDPVACDAPTMKTPSKMLPRSSQSR